VIASGVKQNLSGQSPHPTYQCFIFRPSLLRLAILGLHKNHSTPSVVPQLCHSPFSIFYLRSTSCGHFEHYGPLQSSTSLSSIFFCINNYIMNTTDIKNTWVEPHVHTDMCNYIAFADRVPLLPMQSIVGQHQTIKFIALFIHPYRNHNNNNTWSIFL
jgi:hypothetical protein